MKSLLNSKKVEHDTVTAAEPWRLESVSASNAKPLVVHGKGYVGLGFLSDRKVQFAKIHFVLPLTRLEAFHEPVDIIY